MRTHEDLIDAWGVSQMAQDMGVSYNLVHSWKHRNVIPYEKFPMLVQWAPLRGIQGITLETLYALHRGATGEKKSTRSKKKARRPERTAA